MGWETIKEIWDKVAPYWGWISFALCASLMGEVLKNTLWSKELGRRYAWAYWGRKSMPAHAMILGAVLGVWLPLPENVRGLSASLYYMTAGMASSFAYQLAKRFLRSEDGFEITILGESEEPPPLPNDQTPTIP